MSSILSLQKASLELAKKPILEAVDWHIQARDHIALVGRNGAGKSTLLRVMQKELTLDAGVLQNASNLTMASLTQDIPIVAEETVFHFLVKRLGEIGELLFQYKNSALAEDFEKLTYYQQMLDNLQAWDIFPRIEMITHQLGIDSTRKMKELSGGMNRRVGLAAALIVNPELLLLDEPTNHLDIPAIEWLENYLKSYHGALIVITHDRAFLRQVADQIVEIDRGKIYTYHCSYDLYLERREALMQEEERHNKLFDKRLSQEEAWIRTGIKARRTRNEGRVRALEAMRKQYAARREQLKKAKNINFEQVRSSMLVLEAEQISYSIENKAIIQDFSLLLMNGDKIGIIGPNGCGKTTLIRLLLGELSPEKGSIRRAQTFTLAYFSQLREALNEDRTVMENVADGATEIIMQGKKRHVASYLRDFLFPPEVFNQRVGTLSGGEKARLLLAKLFTRSFNVLVMDEPTNDLDKETLELLEDKLIEYKGTLLLISHDRDFINQVVTSVLVYESGKFNEYVGGYDAYLGVKKRQGDLGTTSSTLASTNKTATIKKPLNKPVYKDKQALKQVLQKIEKLEADIESQQLQMGSPGFYQQEQAILVAAQKKLATAEDELNRLYTEWEALESGSKQ